MQRRRPLRERFGAPSFGRRIPRFNFEALRGDISPNIINFPSEPAVRLSSKDEEAANTYLKIVGGEPRILVSKKKSSE